ncbi:hypothetical protein VCHA50P416_80060 [Vibrio chagasii]|nr:hypothetical protein VCHA43P272_60178 [Vibrio chagasii]CAH7358677.1 hypothetical protein VCHA42P256_80061 [Vibrio chagasii]CAH7475438.1 hypothetical protein VCHA50P416_80060 [Vibrio chagasii]
MTIKNDGLAQVIVYSSQPILFSYLWRHHYPIPVIPYSEARESRFSFCLHTYLSQCVFDK